MPDGLLGWSASLAHQLDLGAGSPGINPKARELYEEGVRIPPLRIDLDHELGPDGLLSAMLAANIRVPNRRSATFARRLPPSEPANVDSLSWPSGTVVRRRSRRWIYCSTTPTG